MCNKGKRKQGNEKAQTENVMISEDLVNVFAKLSDVVNNMELNKVLAESTDELKELRKTAKQALEDDTEGE